MTKKKANNAAAKKKKSTPASSATPVTTKPDVSVASEPITASPPATKTTAEPTTTATTSTSTSTTPTPSVKDTSVDASTSSETTPTATATSASASTTSAAAAVSSSSGGSGSVCQVCGKPSVLRCPRCSTLRLPDAHFCGQACFRAAWPIHKQLHVERPAEDDHDDAHGHAHAHGGGEEHHCDCGHEHGFYDPRFAHFEFTGGVRPGKVSPRRLVPKEIPRPDYAETGLPASEVRMRGNMPERKTPEMIEGMRAACRVAREVLDTAAKIIRPGITTDEIDRVVHEATIARGAYPSPLNYRGFPKSVCTSVNEIICHGIPDSRVLCDGDIVNVDVTCYYKGYHGDLNETYPVGNIDEDSKRLIKTTYECLQLAISACKPGVHISDVGDIISKHADTENLSVVRSYCGHGIGKLFHGNPSVPHYAHNKASGVMKSGNTFTIEPMINLGTYHDVLWPDDWTSSTRDGKRSAQFEHTLLITSSGCEVLTARTADSFPYWFLTNSS